MEPIEGSETSAISFVTPGNYPKENILHTGHGESLKSRTLTVSLSNKVYIIVLTAGHSSISYTFLKVFTSFVKTCIIPINVIHFFSQCLLQCIISELKTERHWCRTCLTSSRVCHVDTTECE